MNSSCIGGGAKRPHAIVFLTVYIYIYMCVWKIVYYSPQGVIKQNNGLTYYQVRPVCLVVAQVINGSTRWGKARSVTND